jgi:hypothetical protein
MHGDPHHVSVHHRAVKPPTLGHALSHPAITFTRLHSRDCIAYVCAYHCSNTRSSNGCAVPLARAASAGIATVDAAYTHTRARSETQRTRHARAC